MGKMLSDEFFYILWCDTTFLIVERVIACKNFIVKNFNGTLLYLAVFGYGFFNFIKFYS